MDIFVKQFPTFLSPNQSSSMQLHAEYADRDSKNNRTQAASLKISLQTLKVSTGASGNNNATDDDITMSELDYPMGKTTNSSISHLKSNMQSSINTGQIQQQADLAHMLQPTVRALQSATDKAINKSKEVANEAFIGPRFANERRTMRRIFRAQASNLNSQNPSKKKRKQAETNHNAVDNTNAKPKRTKKKKKNGDTIFRANLFDGSVNKVRKRNSKEGEKEPYMLYLRLMERHNFEERRRLAYADLAARAVVFRTGPESRQRQEMYEQKYQARTTRMRERQIRDENALMSALNGLSLDEPKDANDDCDVVL
ncbi:83eaecea-58ba-4350-905a-cd3234635ccf [Sclerotinia trifoliorum]|uniref:83eaecea-58ba-4350-905a-cd3234635ccf n=1 Tax=Sclerotinia trifoliorum TaxID=28548 RepID=A0A8H2ZNS4_9HELO|nr:83eaecea-58ba-4350-905a-cd3234635ccf [Sclerotinia trifoliorum]